MNPAFAKATADKGGSWHERRGGAVMRLRRVSAPQARRAVVAMSDFGEDVGDVGLVEERESETLLAEVVEESFLHLRMTEVLVSLSRHGAVGAVPPSSAARSILSYSPIR